MADTYTMKANLFIPQVIADMVDKKLTDNLAFGDIVDIDTNLVGNPGDQITVPAYAYIGDAADVAENVAIDASLLSSTSKTVKVKKAAKGVGITDEAATSGYGDPIGQATRQLGTSIGAKLDNDVLTTLGTITSGMTVGDGTATISADFIADALVKFGEDVDNNELMAGFIAPSQLAQIRKDPNWIPPSEIAAELKIRGTVGMIHGVQLKVSNKIKAVSGKITGYIVRKGVATVVLKKDTNIEVDRVAKNKRTDIYADKHYTVYLSDESKGIKIITKE